MALEIHLVSHTHWDREWYRPAEVFRLRLVDLVDDLLDAPPPEGASFLLDGQTIVLEDYLEVRRDRRDDIVRLLRTGRLEAGPWYVLADELIPSGEAIVRNLLIGRRQLSEVGAVAPPVLYCPDSFGHPAVLPEIALGFCMELVVLWRGYGGKAWPSGDVVRWRGPSGAEVTVFHLPPDGYEFGSSLPTSESGITERWRTIRATLGSRSRGGVTLLQNGADHHARQHDLGRAIELLGHAATNDGDRVFASSMRAFAASLLGCARGATLPVVDGELRNSYGYAWTLQGTFGTRAAQKRANARAERALLAAESWNAVAWLRDSVSSGDKMRAAWRTLLAAHPHDTLCGTSIDAVASAFDVRVRAAKAQASELRRSAWRRLLGESSSPKSQTWIQNGRPFARGGVIIVERVEKLADERVGPGSGNGPDFRALQSGQSSDASSSSEQLLGERVMRRRIETSHAYPDNDIVRVRTVAMCIDPVPGLSLSPLDSVAARTPSSPARGSRNGIASGSLEVSLSGDGHCHLVVGDRRIESLIHFEDCEDKGDLYTPSIGDRCATPELVGQRVERTGPLIADLTQVWRLASKEGRTRSRLTVQLGVRADSDFLEVVVQGENRSKNHRLRIGFAVGESASTVIADAAFGPVTRVPPQVSAADREMEIPSATQPLHRYVSVYSKTGGVTVHSDGLAEYEVDATGIVWITLVRAVGELSRNDLPERPGHAGWPEDTPAAQSLGGFSARFAIQFHGVRGEATTHVIERASDTFLHPLRGIDMPLAVEGTVQGGIELSGTALACSAIKESDDGRALILRCVNQSDKTQKGRWTIGGSINRVHLARLDETEIRTLPFDCAAETSTIEFDAAPRAIVTLRVTR